MFLDRGGNDKNPANVLQEAAVRGAQEERDQGSANTGTLYIIKQLQTRVYLCVPQSGHGHQGLQIWPGIGHIIQKMPQRTVPVCGTPYVAILSTR